MNHVSVSELLTLQRCKRAWHFAHQRRLEPLERPHMLASGSAVHATVARIAAGLAAGSSREHELEYAMDTFAEFALVREFELDDYADAKVAKLLPGVKRAVAKLPAWFFKQGWQVEVPLSLIVPVRAPIAGVAPYTIEVEVRGRADLVGGLDTVPVDDIILVEAKTTKHDPLEYLLWNPQHRFYGLMLAEAHPQAVITFRYLCLPTDQTKKAPEHMPWVFTEVQMQAARSNLVRLVRDWMLYQREGGAAQAMESPSESSACAWCDYAPLCTTILTGGDVQDVVKERFKVKRERA